MVFGAQTAAGLPPPTPGRIFMKARIPSSTMLWIFALTQGNSLTTHRLVPTPPLGPEVLTLTAPPQLTKTTTLVNLGGYGSTKRETGVDNIEANQLQRMGRGFHRAEPISFALATYATSRKAGTKWSPQPQNVAPNSRRKRFHRYVSSTGSAFRTQTALR